MGAASYGEAILELGVDDRVASDNERSGFVHLFLPTSQNLSKYRQRKIVCWIRDDVEGGHRLTSHRIYIGQSIRCGDLSEIERIVDNWRKEVHGLDECEIVGDEKHAGIVERLATYKKSRIAFRRERSQNRRQVARTHFRSSTSAPRERGETEKFFSGFRCVCHGFNLENPPQNHRKHRKSITAMKKIRRIIRIRRILLRRNCAFFYFDRITA